MSDTSARLRAELIRHRDLAGLSGRQLGDRAPGMSRETVRRFERGDTGLSVARVQAWLDVCNVPEHERVRILDLAERALGETRPWADLLAERGHAQGAAHALEQGATLVQTWQPLMIPGLLQTPEYARATLDLGLTTDVDAAVAARVGRQQQLYDGPARFEFLLSERVLDGGHVADEVRDAQRDRLASLARLERVELKVVPARAMVVLPHPFAVYSGTDTVVGVELVQGAVEWRDQATVNAYLERWDELARPAQPL